MKKQQFVTLLECLLTLQNRISAEFLKQHSHCVDFQLLSDFPNSGQVEVGKKVWEFHKHGLGFSFRGNDDILVDIHKNIDSPNQFDLWRISLFLESKNIAITDEEIEQNLYDLVQDNVLRVKGKFFEFRE